MAKNTFLSFSTTPADNTDVGGVGIQGANLVSNFDDAFRTLMAILRGDLDNGTVFVTRSTGYTAVAGDNNAFYEFTATSTLALTAAATLAADWHMMVFANGGMVTVDPDASEQINGANTLTIANGDAAFIICTGTAFKAITIPGAASVAKLAAVNTFTKTQTWAKGADVASASALTPGTDGNYFDVTGTTTITSINTVGVGTVIKLHFDAALTLTHHATDLVLPGGISITTAAGDEAEFVEYASGDWRCTSYQRATSPPPIITPWVAYTPTFTGFGTVTGLKARSRRVGANLEIQAIWANGTVSGATASMTIGFNGTSANVNVDNYWNGLIIDVGGVSSGLQVAIGIRGITEGNATVINFGASFASRGGLTPAAGTFTDTGMTLSLSLSIPIQGWN